MATDPTPPLQFWYSASTRGFYLTGVHDDIPEDAVELTQAEHTALMDGQAAGQIITPDENGAPILVTPPPVPVIPPDSIGFEPEYISSLRAALGLPTT